MALLSTLPFFILMVLSPIHNHLGIVKANEIIGVNYGMRGNNLPPPEQVIKLCKTHKIYKIRLYDPEPSALKALMNSKIEVTIGIKNQDLPQMASSQEVVNSWFAANVEPYLNGLKLTYIAAGNEVIPGNLGQYVLPVMKSVQAILDLKRLVGVKVTTVVPSNILESSYPPSSGGFSAESSYVLKDILRFLSLQQSPLLINVYPYFAYASDPVNVRLDYAQFTASTPVIQDKGLSYYNLFDAMVDAFFWAMEKEGVNDVNLVVSESGWPSAGNGNFTTYQLASTYNQNFVNHIVSRRGTPKRPGAYIQGFVFALFNENLKSPATEQNFGLFYPNMTPVYQIVF